MDATCWLLFFSCTFTLQFFVFAVCTCVYAIAIAMRIIAIILHLEKKKTKNINCQSFRVINCHFFISIQNFLVVFVVSFWGNAYFLRHSFIPYHCLIIVLARSVRLFGWLGSALLLLFTLHWIFNKSFISFLLLLHTAGAADDAMVLLLLHSHTYITLILYVFQYCFFLFSLTHTHSHSCTDGRCSAHHHCMNVGILLKQT